MVFVVYLFVVTPNQYLVVIFMCTSKGSSFCAHGLLIVSTNKFAYFLQELTFISTGTD